jgi:hypothetical protein
MPSAGIARWRGGEVCLEPIAGLDLRWASVTPSPSSLEPPPLQSPGIRLRCQNCGAELVVAEGLRTSRCPYCASPSVVERPPTLDRPAPIFVLGFSFGQKVAQAKVRAWLKRRGPFTISAVRTASLEEVKGVYVPAYLYSATAHSTWSAEIGETYTVSHTETYTDSDGKTQTRTVTRTETEWRHLDGEHATSLTDVLVTASRGLSNAALQEVEPFDLKLLRRYQPALLAGWIAEEPSLGREACLALAQNEAMGEVGRALGRFLPGDRQRALQHQTTLEGESLDLCLVPIWMLAARYHPEKPPVRIVVNGQTGEVSGHAPKSWVKISLAVLLALLLVAGIVFWVNP